MLQKCVGDWGSAPDHAGGTHSTSPARPSLAKVAKGKEGIGGKQGLGKERETREGYK